MINTYSEISLTFLKRAGELHIKLQKLIYEKIKVGVSLDELEEIAIKFFETENCESAFLGFHGYPRNICISVNEELIHGIPKPRKLEHLDVLSIDIGVSHNKMIVDGAFTVVVSNKEEEEKVKETKQYQLTKLTYDMLQEINDNIDSSWSVGSIPKTLSRVLQESKKDFYLTPQYCGHGVGRSLHEEPKIPNTIDVKKYDDLLFRKGMVFAIEPMLLEKKSKLKILNDKWTVVTKNRALTAHFEETFIVDYDNKVKSISNFKNTNEFSLIKS